MAACCAARPSRPLAGESARSAVRAQRVRPAAVALQKIAADAAVLTEAPASAEEQRANDIGEQMRQWIEDSGGYVHPALRLSLATRHRGIVAAEPISLREAAEQPLIAVPERLLLTTEDAEQRLGPALARAQQQQQRHQQRRPWWALGQGAQQAQQPLDPTLLLALLLAMERRKGPTSFWFPYIAALSQEVPCGWALGPAQLAAALAELGGLADGWQPRVAAAAAAVQRRCEAAAAAYGPELGLTAGELRWALGHVVSRSFGSGGDLALLPFIDLCNHQQFAGTPTGYAGAGGRPCAAIYSLQQGEPRAVAAGEEVCVSYMAGTSPLNLFLNFGFVPDECRGRAQP